MLHGRLFHSVDMVLITLLCIVFWFNPVLWLYRQTIAKIHEFEVDAIIARQNGAADYSALLAKTALARNGFLLAHHFNQSFILKRINMINMIKSKISNWKLVGLAAVVAICFTVIACTEPMAENNSTKERTIDKTGEVFTIVEKSATPLNGMTEFYADIANQLQYPEQARKMGVEGKVFVEFIINKNGALSDFKILKGIGAGCDAEAIRVLKTMKDWDAGTQDGIAVRQSIVLPITFKLN
jgi:TonB family protein